MAEVKAGPPLRGRVWPRRIGLGIAAVFVLYLLVGFLGVPRWVEWQLVSLAEEQLGLTPTIERVRFDPLRLRLGIEGFMLAEPDEPMPLLAFDSLLIDLDGPIGFLRADLSLDEIEWVGARVSVVREESGELSWLRLWAAAPARAAMGPEADGDAGGEVEKAEADGTGPAKDVEATDTTSPDEPLIVDLGRLRIVNGALAYRDRARRSPFDATLGPIDLELEDLSTRAGTTSPGTLAIRIGEAGALRWEGVVAAEPMHSKGQIELEDLDLMLPWRYLKTPLRLDLLGGRLGFELDYEITTEDGLTLAIRAGSGAVEALELVGIDDGAPLVTLPSLRVDGVEADVDGARPARLGIASIVGESGRIALRREPDGRLQLTDAFRPRADEAPAVDPIPAAARETEGDPRLEDDAESEPVAEPSEAIAEGGAGPEIEIERLSFEDFAIDFDDRSASSPVSLDLSSLSLEVENYGNSPGRSMTLRARSGVGESGSLSLEGPIALDPLEGQLELVVKDLALAPFRPYLTPMARLERLEGSLSSTLTVGLAPSPSAEADGVGESTMPDLNVRGGLSVDGLRTVDPLFGAEFLGWRGLRLEGLAVDPKGLVLAEVGLEGLRAEIIQGADGRSNLSAIFGAQEPVPGSRSSAPRSSADPAVEEAGQGGAEEPDLPIRIERVSITDSGLVFVDRSGVDRSGEGKAFSVALTTLSGRVEGLSSEPGASAQLELEADLDGTAPLRLSGTLDPLAPKLSGQLALTARGISLPSFSPLIGRFAGLGIARGKLDLDLDYGLEADRLDARNQIVIDGLRFGEKVPGSSGLSLPLPLAVAVLRDASGKIRLDIPVQGDLGDPSFRLLGVLGKTLVQIITKAATTPFALLPIPGGGDASHVGFAPGTAALGEKEEETLRAVADVLSRKPELIVEILGMSDRSRDGHVLKAARLEQALRRRAHSELSEREQRRVGEPGSDPLSPPERLRALEQLYVERLGRALPPDPSARSGEVLEAALIDAQVLDEDALEALARERARQVQVALQGDPRVEGERVRLREIEVRAGNGSGARVQGAELSLSVR